MNLLSRYIIFEITKYFCMALSCVLTMFVAIDYLNYMDKFIEANISLWRAMQYVLYKIPFISSQAIPVVLLMAILIVFGLMSKHKELVAINAGGISIYTLIRPVMLVCAVMTLLIFLLTEALVPDAMLKSNAIRYQEIRKTADVSKHEKNIWMKGHQKITHIKFFDPASQAIFGFTQYNFDDQFRLIQRVDAHKGGYQDGVWELADGMVQRLNKAGGYDTTFYSSRKENLELHPKDFQKIVRQSTEMNYNELRDYVRKVEREGYDGTVYKVDLYAKSAYPFICIICLLYTSDAADD